MAQRPFDPFSPHDAEPDGEKKTTAKRGARRKPSPTSTSPGNRQQMVVKATPAKTAAKKSVGKKTTGRKTTGRKTTAKRARKRS